MTMVICSMSCLVGLYLLSLGHFHHYFLGIFRSALPEFKALEEFEWIGYPELQADLVKVLLKCHPNLTKLGLMYLPTAN
jgi:hypothetical protein